MLRALPWRVLLRPRLDKSDRKHLQSWHIFGYGLNKRDELSIVLAGLLLFRREPVAETIRVSRRDVGRLGGVYVHSLRRWKILHCDCSELASDVRVLPPR